MQRWPAAKSRTRGFLAQHVKRVRKNGPGWWRRFCPSRHWVRALDHPRWMNLEAV
jgi:hypothetical protein